MLIAHLVPSYFAVAISQPGWKPEWSKNRRAAFWIVAFSSTVVPDLDVMYNALFRGFFNHSILWTHSLFPYLCIVLTWWLMRRIGRWPYFQLMIGLIAIGGMSHLVLDVVAHSTPLLYPFSMHMFGFTPSSRVLQGGVWGYLTDPILLLEPFLIAVAIGHWTAYHPKATPQMKKVVLVGLIGGFAICSAVFLLLLPVLQPMVAARGQG